MFIDLLKPWRELIAIAAMLTTAGALVLNYFATKRQVEELRCHSIESISLARSETTLLSTFDEIIQKGNRVDLLETKSHTETLLDTERMELKRLQRQIRDLEKRRDAATAAIEQAEKILKGGGCNKEK